MPVDWDQSHSVCLPVCLPDGILLWFILPFSLDKNLNPFPLETFLSSPGEIASHLGNIWEVAICNMSFAPTESSAWSKDVLCCRIYFNCPKRPAFWQLGLVGGESDEKCREDWIRHRKTWLWVPALPLPFSVILGWLLNFSDPQFLICELQVIIISAPPVPQGSCEGVLRGWESAL